MLTMTARTDNSSRPSEPAQSGKRAYLTPFLGLISAFAKRLSTKKQKRYVGWLYDQVGYLEAYRAHTNFRVLSDPQMATGGKWGLVGKLQFDFLCKHGLRPQHRMLDIGCGTLRGGQHFIRYLDSAHYVGMDISPKVISLGKKLLQRENLSAKRPELYVNRAMNLRFEELHGRTFDVLLAQSVFTHLLSEHIDECFQHVGNLMSQEASFFFTFFEAEGFAKRTEKSFCYPRSFFESLASRHGFLMDSFPDYDHPLGQQMVRLKRP